MKLDERILAAIAGGALLGATGCRPSPVPETTEEVTVQPVPAEEPQEGRQDPAPEQPELDVVPAPPDPAQTAMREKCLAGFTDEDIADVLQGRGATRDDRSLQCEATCRQLQTSWGGPNTEYYRVCGPWDEGRMCCHVYSSQERRHYRGRPFVVEGSARTAAIASNATWASRARVDVTELDGGNRETVARAWASAGAEEHASIASFSQFLLDLMSLGAPPELVLGVTRAIDDEVRHAQACFGIAGAVAGAPIGPGAIDMHGTQRVRGRTEILRSAIREGCIGEALAAHLAGWSAEKAIDPSIKGALTAIADDEGRHAALAWEFVAWLLAVDSSLAPVAREEFAGLEAPNVGTPEVAGADLTAWGVIAPHIEAELNARAIREIIAPAAAALFAGTTG